jgi:hypothetical protein
MTGITDITPRHLVSDLRHDGGIMRQRRSELAEKSNGGVSEKRHDGEQLRRKPWEAIGMSRGSWYRHGKPTEKPKRTTHKDVAKSFGVSLRTVQRAYTIRSRERREELHQALRDAGFNGPPFGERAIAWVQEHPEICASNTQRMFDKLERGARLRDWRRISDQAAAHPEITQWLVTTVNGAPLELEAFTAEAALEAMDAALKETLDPEATP